MKSGRGHWWWISACVACATAHVHAQDADAPPRRESVREFLDSEADKAVAPDPGQTYRKNGQRREIDIVPGLYATLDEVAPSRLGTGVMTPAVAGESGRTIGLSLRRSPWLADLWYHRSSVGRDAGASVGYEITQQWQLRIDGRERRNDDEQLKRRDFHYGLRYQPRPGATIDLGLHRAQNRPGDVAEHADARFARASARWEPAGLPGLGLHAAAEHPLQTEAGADQNLERGRIAFGADYRIGANGWWPPALVYWREAPRLGLLSDGNALELRAAYRREVGIELPYGEAGNVVYSHVGHRSLADDRDLLWVVGARHRFDLARGMKLHANVEQATPIAGSGAERSFSVGGRLEGSRFPRDSFSLESSLVESQTRDSVYGAYGYTARLSDSVLAALRTSTSRGQTHADAGQGTTEYKAALAFGWREPERRRLHVLGRHTVLGRLSTEAGITDRHAQVLLAYVGMRLSESDAWSARWSRRWDHDALYAAAGGRTTNFALVRGVHDLAGRWSLSAHVARREDSVFGPTNGYGIELGYRLSSKAVLALGYNPSGFNDNEISIDERTRKGWNLRLRFSIDSVLSRWLDTPLPAGTAQTWPDALPLARADLPLR